MAYFKYATAPGRFEEASHQPPTTRATGGRGSTGDRLHPDYVKKEIVYTYMYTNMLVHVQIGISIYIYTSTGS